MGTGAANRRRGVVAERHLVAWLRVHGWPGAERTVVTGYRTAHRERRDGGDVAGTPGLVWSLKDCATERIPAWWSELEVMDPPGAVRLLVVKNRGHADPGRWWCWLTVAQLADLLGAPGPVGTGLVRMHLDNVAPLLRRAGFGVLSETGPSPAA